MDKISLKTLRTLLKYLIFLQEGLNKFSSRSEKALERM